MTEQCYRCEYQNRCNRKKEFRNERCHFFNDQYTISSIKNILGNYQKQQEDSEQKVYDFISYMLIVEEKNEKEVKEFLNIYEVGNADACNMIAISIQYHIDTIARKRQKEGRQNIIDGITRLLCRRRPYEGAIEGSKMIANGIHKIKWVKQKHYSNIAR